MVCFFYVVQDGRLRPGDQLIAMNKESLIGMTHEEAKSMLNKVKIGWEMLIQSLHKHPVHICRDHDLGRDYSGIHSLFTRLCLCVVTHFVSRPDTTVEIAFIPGKGLFPSSASLHNGIQRPAGNNYHSGRLKVHIRSPEVSLIHCFKHHYTLLIQNKLNDWMNGGIKYIICLLNKILFHHPSVVKNRMK